MKEVLKLKNAKLESDDFTVINILIGYTQGELDEEEDYDDAFKAKSHVYWKFTVARDLTGELDCDYLLIDWENEDNTACFQSDEDLAKAIGLRCQDTTEDMFGDVIQSDCFESVVLGILDEPEGYICMDNVLEEIGGEIRQEENTDKIPEELVNSLFALSEEIDSTNKSIQDGKIFISGEELDLENDYSVALKYVAFSEDVMCFGAE